MTIEEPEHAIRRYLTSMRDPSVLIDNGAVERLNGELSGLTDPIERLVARQALLDASEPDVAAAEEAFVDVVGDWARGQGISAASFLAEGVPPAVLRRAGISVPKAARSRRRRTRTTVAARAATRRSRVTRDEIRHSVPREPFTAAVLIDLTGASPDTVRKTIAEMLDDGSVVEKGQDPDHTGPGRAPTLYATP
jgi:hypothetical protein